MFRWRFWSPSQEPSPALDATQAAILGLQRSEGRLWASATLAASVTLVAFVAAYLPRTPDPLFQAWFLPPEKAAPSLLGLFLLHQTHLLWRRWGLRQKRRELSQNAQPLPVEATAEPPATCPVTGLSNAKAAEDQLAREIILARKNSQPLSLLVIGLDQFDRVSARNGEAANQALVDFTRQLRRALRLSDFAVRMNGNEFLAVLPGCPLKNVQRIVDRLEPVMTECDGAEFPITYSTAWVDPDPGESPGEAMRRASKMLRLYQDAERNAAGPAAVAAVN